jgi:hypothetical protein
MRGHKKAESQIEDIRPDRTVGGDSSSPQTRIARMLARDLRPARPLASAQTWPPQAFQLVDKRITIATSTSELEQVGQLRYELLFGGTDKTSRLADHSLRQFIEPVDDLSLHIRYGADDQPQAAVRLTRASEALADPHLQLILDASGAAPTSCTVIWSRLAIAPHLREQSLAPLFRQLYRSALVSGACYCLLAASDEMACNFELVGFRPLGSSVTDPIGGVLRLWRLDAYDVAHLRTVKSPCLAVAEELFSPENDPK